MSYDALISIKISFLEEMFYNKKAQTTCFELQELLWI